MCEFEVGDIVVCVDPILDMIAGERFKITYVSSSQSYINVQSTITGKVYDGCFPHRFNLEIEPVSKEILFNVGDIVDCTSPSLGGVVELHYGRYEVVDVDHTYYDDPRFHLLSVRNIDTGKRTHGWYASRFALAQDKIKDEPEYPAPVLDEVFPIPDDTGDNACCVNALPPSKKISIRLTIGYDNDEEFHTQYHSQSVDVSDAKQIINKILEGI